MSKEKSFSRLQIQRNAHVSMCFSEFSNQRFGFDPQNSSIVVTVALLFKVSKF